MKQLIHGNTTFYANNDTYHVFSMGGCDFYTANIPRSYIPVPGVISRMKCLQQDAPLGGRSRTQTVRLNGINTTITDVTSTGEYESHDYVHTVDLVDGNYISLYSDISSSGTDGGEATISLLFESENDYDSLLLTHAACGTSGAYTKYIPVMSAEADIILNTYDTAKMYMPGDFTISNMIAYSVVAPGAGYNNVVTLMKNGVDQALAVTINGTDKLGQNAVNSVAFTRGDTICIKLVGDGGAACNKICVSFKVTAANANEYLILGNTCYNAYMYSSATYKYWLHGLPNTWLFTSGPTGFDSLEFYLRNPLINLVTAPGAGTGNNYELFSNEASIASFNISDTNTQYDGSDEIIIPAELSYDIRRTPVGAPANSQVYWSFIASLVGSGPAPSAGKAFGQNSRSLIFNGFI
jgi:hypothetical protein